MAIGPNVVDDCEGMTEEDYWRAMDEAMPAPTFEDQAKDSERYRLLRRGQHWSVINGIGDTLRADQLDAAIDAELATHNAEIRGD